MNGSVFSKARYMNGVGFEILARTPVPKLPLSYPPPHPPSSTSMPEGIFCHDLVQIIGVFSLIFARRSADRKASDRCFFGHLTKSLRFKLR